MEQKCKCPPPGLPGWMGTFADLMSLLMCFFVLLLAFSEMDVLKFKQIAGSMKYAFGVQNQLEVKDIPKGTSVIAQEFRPGRPDPTPIDTIMQQTIDVTQNNLNFQAGDDDSAGGSQEQQNDKRGGESQATDSQQSSQSNMASEAQQQQTNELVKKIAQQLEQQIIDGALEVESLGQQIIIRVRENGSFPSGSAFLQPQFKPIIRQIGELLKDVPGEITISGHTDDRAVVSELYRSNWELSSERAVAVAHELLKVKGFEPHRMKVVGLADSRPLVPNNSDLNRRRNRRVEIAILQGKPKESTPLPVATENSEQGTTP